MKKIIFLIIIVMFYSCGEAGTIIRIDKGNNENIELYRYYYDETNSVIIARLKNCPCVQTTTYMDGDNQKTIISFKGDSLSLK